MQGVIAFFHMHKVLGALLFGYTLLRFESAANRQTASGHIASAHLDVAHLVPAHCSNFDRHPALKWIVFATV